MLQLAFAPASPGRGAVHRKGPPLAAVTASGGPEPYDVGRHLQAL